MGRSLAAAAALIATCSLALAIAAGASGSARKTVLIGDNYYSPAKLTIHRGTTVLWKWPKDTGDTHDVNLGSRPKGVKKFHSELVATDYTFKRKLTVPGRYKIFCSIHDDMRMTITVKR